MVSWTGYFPAKRMGLAGGEAIWWALEGITPMTSLPPRHIALALLIAAIWGFNFVVIHVGIAEMPPLLLAALRFVITALPAAFLPRPGLSWRRLVLVGMSLFAAQFGFLFTGMKLGMPAGLASLVLQSQALFTVVFAMIYLGERPDRRLALGGAVAGLGLILIATTIGAAGVTVMGFAFIMLAAMSWGVGNVALRGAPRSDPLALMGWLSLVPPVPLFLLSLGLEGWQADWQALTHMSWLGFSALLYIAVLSTLVGYGAWGYLMGHYPASRVAPFSVLVPVFGTVSAALVLGERFPPLRFAGMGLILVGLAIVLWPRRRTAG